MLSKSCILESNAFIVPEGLQHMAVAVECVEVQLTSCNSNHGTKLSRRMQPNLATSHSQCIPICLVQSKIPLCDSMIAMADGCKKYDDATSYPQLSISRALTALVLQSNAFSCLHKLGSFSFCQHTVHLQYRTLVNKKKAS